MAKHLVIFLLLSLPGAGVLLGGCDDAGDDDTTVPPYDPTDPSTDWDEDGYAASNDCNDFDDAVHPNQEEICDNGVDDDCNLALDCDDAACASQPICTEAGQDNEACDDGIDNDGDGATDCDDEDCEYSAFCSPCSVQVAGTCGTAWNIFGVHARTELDDYSCSGASEAGPEVVYEFLPYADGTVDFAVAPADGVNVDLYLMQDTCHPDRCIADSSSSGVGDDEVLTIEVTAGTYYYLSVELSGDASEEFTFDTICY